MKKVLIGLSCLLVTASGVLAQEDVYPAKEENPHFMITNATIHVGNGQVIQNGTIEVNNGKIVSVGSGTTAAPAGVVTIDAKGKQVYPGLILSVTDLGLKEIGTRGLGSNDNIEIGDLNPSVRSIVAYNTDSKIINTLKSNGILLAGVAPQGGTISGSSSVVQLDAWNWEDAAYKMDNAIHLNMPSLISRRGGRRGGGGGGGVPGGFPGRGGAGAAGAETDQEALALQKIEEMKSFFRDAKAYMLEASHKETNLKFEAVKGLFDKKQKLFIHCDEVKQMLVAIDFVKEFGFDVVVVGGSESWQMADLLKQNNIAVVLQSEHALPSTNDDDIDQPYKTPAALQKAGVLFALNDNHEESRYRNLSFNAGTAAAYGLGKENALQAITLSAAKVLGVADKTGSLEVGKEANIVISDGDILDMKSSEVESAFIKGRMVSLNNKQKQLYERYIFKYGLKKGF